MKRYRSASRLVILLITGMVGLYINFSPAAEVEAIDDDTCLMCHEDRELTKTTADGREVSMFVDKALLTASVHQTNTCASCHSDLTWEHPDDGKPAETVSCAACHDRQSHSYGISVHGLALAGGDEMAPTCKDCHGSHDVLPPTSFESPLHFSRQGETCGACHPDAAEEVGASIHGWAAARGIREAPACTDCHMEHSIEALASASSQRVAEEVCSKCHASERLNTKFGLPPNRVESFFESYHGLAVKGGDASAANCASCHGYHLVLPSSNPNSMIHPDHLVETCGQCHPGATEKFALGKIHLVDAFDGDLGAQVNWWVRRIYLALIFVVVGSLALHNVLAHVRSALAARRNRGATIQRMNRHHRIQHFILLFTFILLALTGFALKYPDSWLAWIFGNDEFIRRWIHRVAGVVMLAAGVWHIGYIAFTREGRQLVKDFWFRGKDFKDIVTNARFLTGHGKEHAKFGRFGYIEKLEYWAVVWGTIIMGVTGLMIWLKMDVTQFFPRWVVDVATTIHYYEAILACLAIVVWHFYHVFFAPGTYPMNWAWWDGKVSEEWYEEEHPLDHSAETLPGPERAGQAKGDGI